MKVRMMLNCKVNGEFHSVGDVVEVSKEDRTILVHHNQAVDFVDTTETAAGADSPSGDAPKKKTKKEIAAEEAARKQAEKDAADAAAKSGDGADTGDK